jgi:hypothetical protein
MHILHIRHEQLEHRPPHCTPFASDQCGLKLYTNYNELCLAAQFSLKV